MAGEIFELTKRYLQKLAGTKEGQELLTKYDQTIGFEVVGKDQVMEITKRYYYPRYSGPDVVGKERFVVDVKGGKVSFREGEDVPVPASNWEEFNQNIKLLAERETFLELYAAKLRPVDAVTPEALVATRLNIYPFLPKWGYASWICKIIRLIAKQNQ